MASPSAQETPAVAAAAGAAEEVKKPKKAVPAYWLFSNSIREEVTKESKEKNGGKAVLGDIAKAMSARWAALPEAEKKTFEDKAAEDRKRYEAELQVYKEATDPAGTLRKKYEHLIPKKPQTAYFLFSQDPAKREQATAALKEANSEAGVKQLAVKLSEMWKAASAEEKAPFEERYKQEHAEFVKKQKEWQATPEFKEIEAAASKQAEQQQKAEAEQPASEAKGPKRSRSVAKAEKAKDPAPAAKRPKAAAQKPAPAKERAAARGKVPEVAIDSEVLAEAGKAGLEGMLRNLAARPEIVASGKSSREVFEALKASGGLVNPAKRALLGAAGA